MTGPRIGKNGQLDKTISFRIPDMLYRKLQEMTAIDGAVSAHIKARDSIVDKLYKAKLISHDDWREMKSTE